MIFDFRVSHIEMIESKLQKKRNKAEIKFDLRAGHTNYTKQDYYIYLSEKFIIP